LGFASACPIEQNAEAIFFSSLIEKKEWARAKIKNVEENFVEAQPCQRRGAEALRHWIFPKIFGKIYLRSVADFSFKEGSRIFKQRAPKLNFRHFPLSKPSNMLATTRKSFYFY